MCSLSHYLYSLYSVVKARHWYDMNVIKDQNRHVKDKYVISFYYVRRVP